jgi:hypothetical protein
MMVKSFVALTSGVSTIKHYGSIKSAEPGGISKITSIKIGNFPVTFYINFLPKYLEIVPDHFTAANVGDFTTTIPSVCNLSQPI